MILTLNVWHWLQAQNLEGMLHTWCPNCLPLNVEPPPSLVMRALCTALQTHATRMSALGLGLANAPYCTGAFWLSARVSPPEAAATLLKSW